MYEMNIEQPKNETITLLFHGAEEHASTLAASSATLHIINK